MDAELSNQHRCPSRPTPGLNADRLAAGEALARACVREPWRHREAAANGLARGELLHATRGPIGGANALDRRSPRTLKNLLVMAEMVALGPKPGKSVFYHGEGKRAAAKLVATDPSYTRIDDLLAKTQRGRDLRQGLAWVGWLSQEEVWWALSRRLARESSGDVRAFGDGAFVAKGLPPVNPTLPKTRVPEWRSRHAGSKHRFADTVFEKVELPELSNNQAVDTIYYNGRDLFAEE